MSETNAKAPHCPRCFRTDCAHPAAWATFSDCDCYTEDCNHALACRKAYAECSGYAESVIPAAVAALTALRERMRWRDVLVELPDEDTAVEAFTSDNTVTTMWLERGRLEDENGVQFGDGFITHWRPIDAAPLPAAPEVQAAPQKPAAFRPTPEQMRMGVFSEADLDLDGVDL